MQCPLCRESVADDNALQVHYLMSCLGYLKNPSTKKQNEDTSVNTRPLKKLVQFRWVKTKPTLAREVYLISSLAGSVKLEWRVIEECFLSDQLEVPQGLHVCQLVVDGDSISTDDFEVSDTSRTVDVLISAAPQADESTGTRSGDQNQEHQIQKTPLHDDGDTQDGRSEVTTQQVPPKGSLYHELIKHQVLHGDSLETLTGGPASELGESSGHQRTRGNGVRVNQNNTQDTASRESDGGHQTTRTNPNTSDLPSERHRDDALRDSLNSDDLQQFLQPTRTRQESNGVAGNVDLGTSEDRESSISDNEEHSVSLSSRDDLERRPELLGQSNGENESRVQPDIVRGDISQEDGDDGVGDQDTNHEEPVIVNRQEMLLVDLHEPSSGTHREGSSRDHREESDNARGRTSDDHREGTSEARRQAALVNDREGTFDDLREQSSVKDRRRPSDDSLDKSSSDRHRKSSRSRREPARGNGEPSEENSRESLGNSREPSSNHREPSSNHREPSSNDREPSSNHRKPSSNHREPSSNHREPSSNHREPSSNHREPSSNHRELSDGSHQRPEDNRGKSSTFETEPSSSRHQERSSGLEGKKSTDGHEPNLNRHDEKTHVIRRRGTSPGDTTGYLSLPTTLSSNIKTQTDTSQQRTDRSGLFTEDLFSSRRSGARSLGRETVISGDRSSRDVSAKTTTDDLLFRSYSTPNTVSGMNTAFTRETIATGTDFGAPSRDGAPGREMGADSRDIGTLGSEEGTRTRDIGTPTREMSARSKEVSVGSREVSAQIEDIGETSNRGAAVPRADTSSSRRDTNYSSRYQPSVSSFSGAVYEPALVRRSPAGSFTEDSDIRRPPLYTSAPSRPYSSQPYTQHTAVSPLSSPRDEETAVSNASRPVSSAGTFSRETRTTGVTTQRLMDRGDPMGSAVSSGGVQAATGGNAASFKQFSEDKVKELLENLKQQQSSRRNLTPETSPRERPDSSDTTSYRQKLADRDEALKKLKAKNSAYKQKIEELREKEIELTKALSLTEATQKALKDQEDISRELTEALGNKEKQYAELEALFLELKQKHRHMTGVYQKEKNDHAKEILELKRIKHSLEQEANQKALKDQEEISRELTEALGDKEKQYAELEALFLELKQEHRHMTGVYQKEKNDYVKEILELRRIKHSLEQEVKTVRELPRRSSPKSSSEYKALAERWEESLAVSASLKDQVKTLEKENKDLKDKLSIFSTRSGLENRTSYTRDTHSTQTGRSLETNREDHSFLNGYTGTSKSPTLLSLEQYRHTDERVPNSTRDTTSTSRRPYDSHRPAFESTRHQSESTDRRTNRSRTQPETTRTRLDIQPEKYRSELEGSQERSESRREPSSEYRPERFQASPVVERHGSRESRSRQRVTTADVVVSGYDYRKVLPRRSHSSDAVRNGVLDGTGSRISPSQERGSQELDKRSKDRSRLYHAGSYEHLNSSHTTSTQRSDLGLTGHRVDFSPTSPDSTTPPTERRFSPGKGTPFAPDSPRQIDVGMTILVTRHRGMSRGIVRYVGKLPEKGSKVYVGIELFGKGGRHDGKFNGHRFFTCKPDHGVFVPFEKVVMAYT